MRQAYDDEDNAPMTDDLFDRIDQGGHNPTVYGSYAQMKAEEALPFTDPPERPPDGCWNCQNFNWSREACTVRWNNMDEDYYNPDIDDRKYTDCCEYHETDPDVDPADWFELRGNEP